MEVALSRSMSNESDELESVVGVEVWRCGHTQLLSPATITEKGVEMGCVTGWPITGEHLAHSIFDMEWDGTHTPLSGPKDISDTDKNITVNEYLDK
jgi:hypothetical protein